MPTPHLQTFSQLNCRVSFLPVLCCTVSRLLIPVAWTICYQMVVPNNLIWSVLVPLCFITWQDGRVPGPGQLEWWLIMVIGLYMKCWGQVCWLAALFMQWW